MSTLDAVIFVRYNIKRKVSFNRKISFSSVDKVVFEGPASSSDSTTTSLHVGEMS
jgi:hypothetical protein